MKYRWASNPRISVTALFVAVVLIVLQLERLAIVSAMRDRFDDVAGSHIFKSFLVGLRFDAMVAAMLVIPFALVMSIVSPAVLAGRRFRRVVCGSAAVVAAIVVFACVCDFFFFREFDERLNHKAVIYLGYRYTYEVIWHQFPVVLAILGTVAMLAAFYWLFYRVAFRRRSEDDSQDIGWRGRIAWGAVQAILIVAAIRGSFGPKALNAGPAYFTSSATLAQLTLNGMFTLYQTIFSLTVRSEELGDHLPVLPEAEAMELATRLIVRPDDRLLNDADNPLRRVTDTNRPREDYNVVLVVLESLSWHYIGAMGGESSLTPNLNKLADEGLFFDHCFAVGDRTTRGFAGIVGGFPDLPGSSVTTRYQSTGNFLTLGEVLARRGYETMFIYGGQPMYDHRQSFLGSNGFNRMVFADQFPTRTFRTELGWCDEDLFAAANHVLDAQPAERPFFATLLTLSFHRPFLIPDGRIAPADRKHKFARQLDAIRYTDWCIGQFMERARRSRYFDRTLFVFVADHQGGYRQYPSTMAGYRVPFLIWGPEVLRARGIEAGQRRVSAVCSQTDVAPTIMAMLGGSYEHCFFGSSVIDRPADAGLALLQRSGDEVSLIAANGDLVLMPFNAEPTLVKYIPPGKLETVDQSQASAESRRRELTRQATALLQAASMIYERGGYRLRDQKD